MLKKKLQTNFVQIINYKMKKTFLQSYTAFDNRFKIKVIQLSNETRVSRLTPALAWNKNSVQH